MFENKDFSAAVTQDVIGGETVEAGLISTKRRPQGVKLLMIDGLCGALFCNLGLAQEKARLEVGVKVGLVLAKCLD